MEKNKNKILSSSNRLLIQSVLSMMILLLVVVMGTIGATKAWYARNQKTQVEDTGITSAPAEGGIQVGHDTFMFNIDRNKGVLKNEQLVTMNQYDMIFDEYNKYTPIVLRAVISGVKPNDKITLSITSKCVDDLEKNKPTPTPENFLFLEDKEHRAGYDFTNFLSNVINLRAAYIPGLATNAEKGNFDKVRFKDADDYIYQSAVEAFTNNTVTAPSDTVKFAGETVHTEYEDGDTEVRYIVSKVTSADLLAKTANQSPNYPDTVKKEYELIGYYIANDNNNVLGANGTSLANYTVGAGSVPGVGTYTQDQYITYEKLSNCLLWKSAGEKPLSSGSSTIYSVAAKQYLQRNSNTNIRFNGAATTWTIGFGTGGNAGKVSFQNNNRYIRFYNSGWTSPTGTQTYLNLYKVEKCTTTNPRRVDISIFNREITIPVNLQAAQEGDGDFYYVYLLIDYDEQLIQRYIDVNNQQFIVGQAGTLFKDYFVITHN